MSKRRPVLGNVLVLLGMFFACCVLIGLMLLMHNSDPLLPPESPETLAKRLAPENAYFPLVDALKLLPSVSAASLGQRMAQKFQPEPGSMGWAAGMPCPDDAPELAKYLKDCEPAFAKAQEALQRPYFLVPIDWTSPTALDGRDDPRANLSRMQAFCGALSARAMLASREGDETRALDYALEEARLCVLMDREMLSGPYLATFPWSIHELAQRATDATLDRALAGIKGITAGTGSNQEAVLFRLREMDFWTGRYWRMASWNDVERGLRNLTTMLNYRGTRKWLRANREIILASADKPFAETRQWARSVIGGDGETAFDAGQGPNARRRRSTAAGEGRGIAGSIADSVYRVGVNRALSRVFLDGAALMVALERCKRAEGGYPERLETLAPTWIDAIPKDAFAGGSLAYVRDGGDYRLYSAGRNLRDDGGGGMSESKDRPSDDDVVIHRPVKKAD